MPYGFQFSKPAVRGVTSIYFQVCWYGALCRTYIKLILVISETVLQLQNCSLLVETVSNEIIDATSPTEYPSVIRNVEKLIHCFTSDNRTCTGVRCQQPDWWEVDSSDVIRNPNPIDLVEVRPSLTMSVRHVVQQTHQTLQFPVKEKDYPCEQTVIKAEGIENATYYSHQPGATAEHHLPSRSTSSMTLITKIVSQLEVCHSEFAVIAGTDIVAMESLRRTGGEADQHPISTCCPILETTYTATLDI